MYIMHMEDEFFGRFKKIEKSQIKYKPCFIFPIFKLLNMWCFRRYHTQRLILGHNVFPQCSNRFKRSIGIGSILDEYNTFFFQNCYLKLVPMYYDEVY
jgi:hypothetical protein